MDGWVGDWLAEWMDCGNDVANEWALRDDDDDDDDDLPEPKETPARRRKLPAWIDNEPRLN